MTARGAWAALALVCGAGAAPSAQAADATRWQVEAGIGRDRLSNGAPAWAQLDLALRHRLAPRSMVELGLRRTERSNRADAEIAASLSLPLDAQWSAALAATLSPSHHVLARGSGRATLARAFEGGWVATADVGRRVFEQGRTTLLEIGGERYVGDWRFAASVGQTRLDAGGGSAASGRLQFDRFFDGERGRIGLILARGRELEGLPATALSPQDVIDQRVTSVALVGVWPLAPAWGLAWEASRLRYDDLRRRSGAAAGQPYQRSGVRVGVRHDF